jgi:hypothetical protein
LEQGLSGWPAVCIVKGVVESGVGTAIQEKKGYVFVSDFGKIKEAIKEVPTNNRYQLRGKAYGSWFKCRCSNEESRYSK